MNIQDYDSLCVLYAQAKVRIEELSQMVGCYQTMAVFFLKMDIGDIDTDIDQESICKKFKEVTGREAREVATEFSIKGHAAIDREKKRMQALMEELQRLG